MKQNKSKIINKQTVYSRVITKINVKDLILNFKTSTNGWEAKKNSLNAIYHELIFDKLEKNKKFDYSDSVFDGMINIDNKIKIVENSIDDKIKRIYKLNIHDAIKETFGESKSIDNNANLFVLPNESIIIQTAFANEYENFEEDLNKVKQLNFEVAKKIFYQILFKVVKTDIVPDIFEKYLIKSLKTKTRDVTFFNDADLDREIINKFKVNLTSSNNDIFDIQEWDIRVVDLEFFNNYKFEHELLNPNINPNWTKAFYYLTWGWNLLNTYQNRLIKRKMNDSFNNKGSYTEDDRFFTIYDIDLIEKYSTFATSLSDVLSQKFDELFEKINEYKDKKKLSIITKYESKKAFKQTVLSLFVIMGTSFISVSGIWELSAWLQEKWDPNFDFSNSWSVMWLLSITLSALLFIATLVYVVIKFAGTYKFYLNEKHILKLHKRNIQIAHNFDSKLEISGQLIDEFNNNIEEISKRNK
ncbi:hypothetical protein [Mycoplasmopsis edwardii]|uniref:Uncharacterized protein n=1 Tax=Mycoplasmopsis edwardii TaxID=53558 RepID=A0ACD4PJ22_9BACT|nr:hypothetical protein [Mycoplasmopsis edwardii]WBP84123.1 hypothetical protein Me_995_000074 [Mycoplasmopsis edwardii]